MPSFENTLVVAISTRALFNLEEENKIFHDKGAEEYRKFQLENENVILKKGTGFHLVQALLNLNKLSEDRLVEVIVMSKNSPETAIRVLNSIDCYNLDITRSAFTGSEPLVNYMEAFTVDLFLSRDEEDVQDTIDSKVCAAALVYDPPMDYISEPNSVRIAFDADAVLFSDESEFIYKTEGMSAFHKNEKKNVHVPMNDGPYAKVLRMLSEIQSKIRLNHKLSPLRIAIVTARNSPSHMRVINTLRKWNVNVDEAFFLGGISKDKILKAFKAHIFFDDQEAHLEKASLVVPSGKVPYRTDSPLKKIDINVLKVVGSFIVPELGNSITQNDLDRGILRITTGIQIHFPANNAVVSINLNGEELKCLYKKRVGRSDVLYIGKPTLASINLRVGGSLKFARIKDGKFQVSIL